MASASDTHPPDDNKAYEVYATVAVVTFLLVITTVTRVATKLYYKLSLTIDDYFIILGASLNIVANAFDCKAASAGFGRHLQYLELENAVTAAKYAQLAVLLADFIIWAVSLSICFFLFSMIRGTHTYFTFFIWGMMVFTSATALVACILWGIQAKPIQKLWDPRVPGTRASPQLFLVIVYVVNSLRLVIELLYSMCPLYFLWGLQLAWSRKLPVIVLTLMGLLLTVTSSVSLAFTKEFKTEDTTWGLVPEFITDIIDRNLMVFVVNLPAIWILFRKLQKARASRNSQTEGTHSSQTGRLSTWFRKRLLSSSNRSKQHSYTEFSRDSTSRDLESGNHGSNSISKVIVMGGRDPYALDDDDIPLRDHTRSQNDGQQQANPEIKVERSVRIENESPVRAVQSEW
ncbi:hypothetical protein EV356DRAFT_531995 [Viridothelium virens]|uniref:Rhodopsin domain-containing protein n=1 Tax=Viridothelium virens TaxID=1048519 RepID=A0A6A6HBP1_VIRVR|nr:hypothetical protein EV356DRAFT_531995 [Viridothelium virens]